MRTLEQLIKFDHNLTLGKHHLVQFVMGAAARNALVSITSRGVVRCLTEPTTSDMYQSWRRIKGDSMVGEGGVFTWPARNPDHMGAFCGPVVCVVDISDTQPAADRTKR